MSVPEDYIVTSKRIGIESSGPESASKPYRFYVIGNPSISVRDKPMELKVLANLSNE